MKQLYTGSVPKLVYSAALVYLFLPFLLFTLFWIRLPYSFILGAVLTYCFLTSVQHVSLAQSGMGLDATRRKQILIGGTILAIWLLFSGIGGFAYQNTDFSVRNAVFRDLIQQPWPVVYDPGLYPATHPLAHEHVLLVYYFGYWLPSALVGKLLGWTAGNIFLYLWTFLGLLLMFALLCQYVRTISYKVVLIFIFWSGLDIVGSLIALYAGSTHPELGPIAHIERWAGSINVRTELSSNTTLLYWVFNQTIPIWLTVLLLMNDRSSKIIFFIIALTLFQAPLGTIGVVPYVLYQLITKWAKTDVKPLLNEYVSVPNTVGALMVVAITGLYFTTNQAGSLRSLVSFGAVNYMTFFLLEVGILGLFLYSRQRSSLLLVCIGVLFCIPFVKIGHSYDFAMRASIPSLLILTALTIKFLFDKTVGVTPKVLVAVYLLIGSVTPALGMARSVFFTSSHVAYSLNKTFRLSDSPLMPAFVKSKIKDRFFLDDEIGTFNKYNKTIPTDNLDQFIGQIGNQPFCRYLLNDKDLTAGSKSLTVSGK